MRSKQAIEKAVDVLTAGGVIAYPTEQCFGLGCDPDNPQAVQRILDIKQRSADQGLILIGLDQQQFDPYADFAALNTEQLERVVTSWPGPNTWLIPAYEHTSTLLRGSHESIAVRATANEICRDLLTAFGKALVSTSANRHGQPPILESTDVVSLLGKDVDYVLEFSVGGAAKPSTIRDALNNQQLR